MIEVIPSILAKTADELIQMIKKLELFVDRAHIDIADGVFVPNTTVAGYDELKQIITPLSFDVHLMVANPQDIMYHWYQVPRVDRYFVHAENKNCLAELLDQIKVSGRRVGLVVNPETTVDEIEEFVPLIECVQFMTVKPGFYGSEFLPDVLYKVTDFRQRHPDMPIAVDGGINPETARRALLAGASVLVSGSYIMKSPDIGKALESLRNS